MNNKIQELQGEIIKTQEVLKGVCALYQRAKDNIDMQGQTIEQAVFLSEIIVNYYTCLETLFFRFSQFFENWLPKDRWHAELLRKMCLDIPDVREAVISDNSYRMLDELRKFRHFKRYYFSMDYDWERLAYLMKKLEELQETIPLELQHFDEFLKRLKMG